MNAEVVTEIYRCGECKSWANTKQEAEECCLCIHCRKVVPPNDDLACPRCCLVHREIPEAEGRVARAREDLEEAERKLSDLRAQLATLDENRIILVSPAPGDG